MGNKDGESMSRISIGLKITCSNDVYIKGDFALLESLVGNLVDNAINACTADETGTEHYVSVTVFNTVSKIIVTVEDNKISFKRNIESEREFNAKNTSPFGGLEWWRCEVPTANDGGEQHVGILKNFASAILDGTQLIAKGEEGINGLTISNAMHLSAWTGETVDLNNFPDEKFYELLQEKIEKSTVVKEDKQVIADTTGTY